MGLLDRVVGLADEQETKRKAAEARARRNISKEAAEKKARERRVKRGSPDSRLEAAESTAYHAGRATAERLRRRTAGSRAKATTPTSERSRLRRALAAGASGLAGVTRTALEAEAEARERAGDQNGAAAARLEDTATAGAPVRDATLDPSPDETLELLAMGGFGPVEEEGLETGEDGMISDEFIMGTGPPGDPDGDGKREQDPLEFDDPLGVSMGGGWF